MLFINFIINFTITLKSIIMNVISPNQPFSLPWSQMRLVEGPQCSGPAPRQHAAPATLAVGRADRALLRAGNFGRGPCWLPPFPCGPWTLLPFLLRALPTCCLPSEDPGAVEGGPLIPSSPGHLRPFSPGGGRHHTEEVRTTEPLGMLRAKCQWQGQALPVLPMPVAWMCLLGGGGGC